MKKLILSLTAISLLSGCQLFSSEETTSETDETASQAVHETTPVSVVETATANEDESSSLTEEEAALEESRSDAIDSQSGSLFSESIVGNSDYPVSSIPEDILAEELLPAINDYYHEVFSEVDKSAGAPRVPDLVLQAIEEVINQEEDLSQLNVTVDQISLQLDGSTIYVPRVVIPMSYSEAESIAYENDIRTFNHALTEVGNRLVMVAYYNSDTDTLMPMHLMNLSNSLFYYEP